MLRKLSLLLAVFALSLVFAVPAYALPGAPNFEAGLWADGERWGTKVTTPLPEATEKNWQSFDAFYFITHEGSKTWVQAPVMEAAPGNPDYNGGRWYTVRVTITEPDKVPTLTSYEHIKKYEDIGFLEVGDMPESDGAHPWIFFQCPLLPFKG